MKKSKKVKAKTREIVINADYGGFSLSREAFLELRKLGNKTALSEPDEGEMWEDGTKRSSSLNDYFCGSIKRDDPDLIKVVKKLKKKANGACASLKVVSIPEAVDWELCEFDGCEHIAERHRTWG